MPVEFPFSSVESAARWVYRPSRLERIAVNASIVAAAIIAAAVLQGSHPVVYLLFAGALAVRFLRRHVYSADHELLIHDGLISWGNAMLPREHESVPLEAIAALRFYRRNDGSGALELAMRQGNGIFIPGTFTDQPGIAEGLIQALRERLPDLSVDVR